MSTPKTSATWSRRPPRIAAGEVGLYGARVLPWAIDRLCGTAENHEYRAAICAGLAGDGLEIGFGSGLNLPHYPSEVTSLLAVDPATYGRRLAAERVAATHVDVRYVGLDGSALPVGDESVDFVLTTWTLCTVPDTRRVLAEVRRVLRPDGVYHYLEHGLATSERHRRWQHRLTPGWRRVAGGCRLNEAIHDLVAEAGFTVRTRTFTSSSGRVFGTLYEGRARKDVASMA